MEHVDWLVSFAIFVFVLLTILTAIPKFLPDLGSKEDIQTSNIIFTSLTENVDVYNLKINNNLEGHTYFLEIDQNQGRANTSYILDQGMVYGTIKESSKFFVFDSNQYNSREKIFHENFLDENNLNFFNINNGLIIKFKGDAYIYPNSEIESKESNSNFLAEYIFEPIDVNIYFNYVNLNNYSLCELDQNSLKLYDKNSSGEYLIDQINDLNFDSNYWINLIFKSNYSGEVGCKIGAYEINNSAQTSIDSGKIIIKNTQEHFINSFRIYQDDFLENSSNSISTRYYDLEIILDNSINLELFNDTRDSIGSIDINFNYNLDNNSVDNKPAIIKDTLNNHKFIAFPNTKEFIFINNIEELSFIINNFKPNHYEYEIEFNGNDILWIELDIPENDIKTIYLKKIEGFTPENDFIKDYNALNQPTVTVTDLLNGYYEIEIDNTGGSLKEDFELAVLNDVIALTSVDQSVYISDNTDSAQENLYLFNENNGSYLLLDFLDNKNNKVTCDIEFIDTGFLIDCNNKTFIKTRIRETISNYPKIILYKNKERIVTYEKTTTFNPDNYYINILNEKENISIGEERIIGDFYIFERITKYLNENGEEEIVSVLIKEN